MEALSIQVDPEVKKVLRREARKHKRSMSKQAAYYIELGIQAVKSSESKESSK